MEILSRFLCDWGSADSNMLLFFLLTSFLLGLLAGWLIWGRKIQAMLNVVAEKEATITDINAKLTAKEADLTKANAEIEALRLKIRQHEEEKGQLRSDLLSCQGENSDLQAKLAAGISAAAPMMAAAPIAEAIVAVPIVPDDLKIVEGIGPKIEELCNGIGIFTWKALSETAVERLQEMLDAAGKRYQIHNPTTWPKQALLAFEGKWDELKVYQDHLKGGREPE